MSEPNPESPASAEKPAAPSAPKRTNWANVVVWVLTAAVLVVGGWWYILRPTPVVTVRDSHQTSGRMIVEGVVEPRLNEATQALRALEYRGDVLEYFQVRDETGVLDAYVDPSDATVPAPGARVRVTGRRLEADGADFAGTRAFLASEVTVLSGS